MQQQSQALSKKWEQQILQAEATGRHFGFTIRFGRVNRDGFKSNDITLEIRYRYDQKNGLQLVPVAVFKNQETQNRKLVLESTGEPTSVNFQVSASGETINTTAQTELKNLERIPKRTPKD